MTMSHAQFPGQRRHVHGVDAAIHGDEQVGVLRQRAHGLLVEAVALAVAVGQVGANVRAQRCQVQVEDGRGGDAVHVVIAVDADAFARLQRRAHALHDPAHVREQQRVVEQFLAGGEEGARLGGGGDAALHKDRVQQPGHVRGALKKSALRLPPAIDEHICRPLPLRISGQNSVKGIRDRDRSRISPMCVFTFRCGARAGQSRGGPSAPWRWRGWKQRPPAAADPWRARPPARG